MLCKQEAYERVHDFCHTVYSGSAGCRLGAGFLLTNLKPSEFAIFSQMIVVLLPVCLMQAAKCSQRHAQCASFCNMVRWFGMCAKALTKFPNAYMSSSSTTLDIAKLQPCL